MVHDEKLLVVDDEEIICRSCSRVFSPQGFRVETISNASRGLELAKMHQYSAILLDIKMPEMDGLQFLQHLRRYDTRTPVILMTGYPSFTSAVSGIRFGASDYITKPFTPEEITLAVQRLIRQGASHPDNRPREEGITSSFALSVEQPMRFLDESWFHTMAPNEVRIGAVLPRSRAPNVEAVYLPDPGETVYQGLPIAVAQTQKGDRVTITSPLSGVVTSVNELLKHRPQTLLGEPCGQGWIATICPTRLEQEEDKCPSRCVFLACRDDGLARIQQTQLELLGCTVHPLDQGDRLPQTAERPRPAVVILDAGSFGEQGPELVAELREHCPAVRVIVVASPDSRWETAYRTQRIFYYAVDPFVDHEIIDVLDAAFHSPKGRTGRSGVPACTSEPFGSITITNPNGTKVRLLADESIWAPSPGLGSVIRQKLLDLRLPTETTPGRPETGLTAVAGAARQCHRVLLLSIQDADRIPGTLRPKTSDHHCDLPAPLAEKVSAWVVQPQTTTDDPLAFDERITEALADHIVREMSGT